MGYISFALPWWLASSTARSWSLNRPGFSRQNRMARKPMNGLLSFGNRPGSEAIGLSPPRSSVRMMTGLGASPSTTAL
jgi:hypothetical protein